MSAPLLSPERALLRLEQLAREQRAAVAREDVEALCRIAELLPSALQPLLDHPLPFSAAQREAIAAIQAAHAEAEAFLTDRMKSVCAQLKQVAAVRRTTRAYASSPPPDSPQDERRA
jgi:hypothetical protein